MPNKQIKILITGGGTGGHIFPAIAIADAIRRLRPDADILFVGANGKMEMDRVPQAGYTIEGLNIAGFQRNFSLRNLSFPYKLFTSLWKARQIVQRFQPDVVVGTGGYASGPVMRAAQRAGIPTLIQEQNSYAGVTNKLLAKRASTVCVAYDHMEKFFPPAIPYGRIYCIYRASGWRALPTTGWIRKRKPLLSLAAAWGPVR